MVARVLRQFVVGTGHTGKVPFRLPVIAHHIGSESQHVIDFAVHLTAEFPVTFEILRGLAPPARIEPALTDDTVQFRQPVTCGHAQDGPAVLADIVVVAVVEFNLQDIERQHIAVCRMVRYYGKVAFGRLVLPLPVFGITHHILRMRIVVTREGDAGHQPHGGLETLLLETGIPVFETVFVRILRRQFAGIHSGILFRRRRIVALPEEEIAEFEAHLYGSRPRRITGKVCFEQLLRLSLSGLRRTHGKEPAQPLPDRSVGTGRIPSGLSELHECLAVLLHTVQSLATRKVPFQPPVLCERDRREQAPQQQYRQ